MNFYYIKEAIRTEETGDQYPQILKMSREHDYYDDNGVYAFSRYDLPEKNPELKYLILDKKSILSDVLSAEMLRLGGFLVNQKVIDILKDFKLPRHKFYPAYIKDNLGKEFRYDWLQMIINYNLNFIDFAKSTFVLTTSSIINKSFTEISISSHENYIEYQSKLESKQIIKLSHAHLSIEFHQSAYDIFKIPILSPSWIISEKLKTALIFNNVTGVSIKESDSVTGIEY